MHFSHFASNVDIFYLIYFNLVFFSEIAALQMLLLFYKKFLANSTQQNPLLS